jgi:hypothetical protein
LLFVAIMNAFLKKRPAALLKAYESVIIVLAPDNRKRIGFISLMPCLARISRLLLRKAEDYLFGSVGGKGKYKDRHREERQRRGLPSPKRSSGFAQAGDPVTGFLDCFTT